MAQFDVLRFEDAGFVIDCQSNLLDHLSTRVVVPLVDPAVVPAPLRRLHPHFEIGEERFLMATHLIGAVPTSSLGSSAGSLASEYLTITNALDFLVTGI